MTAIAAIRHNGSVVMGADRQATGNGSARLPLAAPKIYRIGGWLIGSCGSGRFCQTLEYLVPWQLLQDKRPGDVPDRAYMFGTVAAVIREKCKEAGLVTTDEEGDEKVGGDSLIAYADVLFKFEQDMDITEITTPYDAIGSGAGNCLGSLFTTGRMCMAPADRLLVALAASAFHQVGVGGPFDFLRTGTGNYEVHPNPDPLGDIR